MVCEKAARSVASLSRSMGNIFSQRASNGQLFMSTDKCTLLYAIRGVSGNEEQEGQRDCPGSEALRVACA